MKFTLRVTGWIDRFATAVDVLGLANSIKILVFGRLSSKPMAILLKNGLVFNFEGALDYGVMSHFYKEGYLIQDSETDRVATILDVGANIGDETARFLVHHPNAHIVAIEAAPRNFSLLEKTFEKITNVEVLNCAVWPVKANLKIMPGRTMESFTVIETSDGGEGTIPAITIQDIMEKMDWNSIDILKLDIEGSEYELFTRGNREWTKKVRVFIFEVPDSDRLGTTQKIYKTLSENGLKYNTFVCGENIVLIRDDVSWKLRKVIGFLDDSRCS
ncbi:MAG: FkbM family methyltransferase [Candidatus Macondimonas sp.]